MKTTQKLITLAAAALICGGLKSHAADDAGSLYFHVNAGAVFIQNLKLHSGDSFATTEFNPGARGDVAFGYNLNHCWAVEFETGSLWNRIDKIGGESVSGGHIDLFQVPILANVIYKIDFHNGWTPYLGAGAGGDFGVFDLEPDAVNAHLQVINETDHDIAFAYQAQAGIRYAISPNSGVDFGYKFFGSFDHHWNIEGLGFKTSAIYTHAILLSYSLQF